MGKGEAARARSTRSDFHDLPIENNLCRRVLITVPPEFLVDRSTSSSWSTRASRRCHGQLPLRHPRGMRRQCPGRPLERLQRAHLSGKGSGREGMGWEWEGRAAAGGAGALLPLLSACRTCGSCGLSAAISLFGLA